MSTGSWVDYESPILKSVLSTINLKGSLIVENITKVLWINVLGTSYNGYGTSPFPWMLLVITYGYYKGFIVILPLFASLPRT